MSKWKPGSNVLGYQAVSLTTPNHPRVGGKTVEACISGRDGEIWVNNAQTFKILLKSYIRAKELGYAGPFIDMQDEYILTLDNSFIARALKAIGYSDDIKSQVAWASRR